MCARNLVRFIILIILMTKRDILTTEFYVRLCIM